MKEVIAVALFFMATNILFLFLIASANADCKTTQFSYMIIDDTSTHKCIYMSFWREGETNGTHKATRYKVVASEGCRFQSKPLDGVLTSKEVLSEVIGEDCPNTITGGG